MYHYCIQGINPDIETQIEELSFILIIIIKCIAAAALDPNLDTIVATVGHLWMSVEVRVINKSVSIII